MKRFIYIVLSVIMMMPVRVTAQTGNNYASSSVLSSGQWFKIAVTSDGVYRIDYSKLRQLGLTNPSNPRIFGNNQGQLSYYNNDPRPDDLKELPVSITGNDNSLNEGEYLLFYGKGTNRWTFNPSTGDYDFTRHNYSDTAFYFLTSSPVPGKMITTADEPAQQENYFSNVSDALYIHEQEIQNIIKSGREWFQPVSTVKGIAVNPGFTDILTTEKLKCSYRVAGRSSTTTTFSLSEGETLRKTTHVQAVNLFDATGTYANISSDTALTTPGSSTPAYEIRFSGTGEAYGWLDWLKLQGRRSNNFSGSATKYFDSKSIAAGRITKFSIKCQANDILIWDISDQFSIKQIKYSRVGENITFKSVTDSLRTFLAFTAASATVPLIKTTQAAAQNLHASGQADMVIVTHPLFRKQAEKLASFHTNYNGLISLIVTPEQIYNEFSGGIPDIAAIRNFLRMKYMKQKGTTHPLKYLLLFGDGSFENKTPPSDNPNSNPNFIPTYQSQNSNVYVTSFTSDDFYTLLEDGAGESEGVESIGAGRLPVTDTTQAGILVRKIAGYLSQSNTGNWKNVICLTADDEDGNTHMSDAEGLYNTLKFNSPAFNVEKIYLDAYKQTTSANGQSYPEAVKAINNRINAGCLIFNFTGHGSERGLASEGIVSSDDINSWRNGNRLPLFITATCEFSRFDDIDMNITTREIGGKPSAGEKVLLNNNGGGIALMSTTRIVYSAPNYMLNRNIIAAAFLRDSVGNSMCLGDIIRIAKNNSGTGINKRNFTLLGDPAVKLSYPWHGTVVTDSVNNVPVNNPTDSLKALSRVTISGHIGDLSGTITDSFNGIVSPVVFDKSSRVKTLANDGGQIMEFDMRNNVLFSGKTNARNGRFSFSFIVPRDIDYNFGNGKISYYANNDTDDMNGYYSGIIVGGFTNNAVNDTSGPGIRLFMNDTLFRNGGLTDQNPKLLAIIYDNSGINTTGAGIGHDLTAFIDNDKRNSFILNNYFENDFDNFTSGKLSYDLSGLASGNHTLTLKAWDYYNNSSEKTLLFLVETGGKFILKNLINYPNPFFGSTSITAEHNSPDIEFSVIINIYSLNGRIIKTIKTKIFSEGYNLSPVEWDGNDDGGKRAGRGIYPYSVTVTRSDGATASASGRMIIL